MREVSSKDSDTSTAASHSTPFVPKIITRKNNDGPSFNSLTRPWNRVKSPKNPDLIFVLTRRNYKVYTDIGSSTSTIRRILSILDTGAGPNFIRSDELNGIEAVIRQGPLPDICDANNKPLQLLGTIKLPVRLGNFSSRIEFIVCKTLAAPAILGADFCDRFVSAIRPSQKIVELDDGSSVPIVRRPLRNASRRSGPPLPKDMRDPDTSGRVSPNIKAAETLTVPAQSQAWVKVSTKRHGNIVVQPLPKLFELHSLACANGIASVLPNVAFRILVANTSDIPRRIVRNQNVAVALPHPTQVTETSLSLADVVGMTPDLAQVSPTAEGQPVAKSPEETGKSDSWTDASKPTAAQLDLSHIPIANRERFRQMLTKYDELWDGKLGKINAVDHRIELKPGSQPSMQRPYRTGPQGRRFVEEEIGRMIDADVIEPAETEWDSPVVIAPKADGSYRFCVDYRKLNSMTVRSTYPLPRMDDCIDSLGEATIFSTLDANWGYWQIPVAAADRDKATFTSHAGTYRFKRMPFGLMNAPATFQRTLDILLNRYAWRTCLVYLDDIIIFSKDFDTHIKDVDKILGTLRRSGISLKLRKCEWCTDTVKYLGHVIKPGRLTMNEAHTKSLRDVQHPTTLTELRSFLGLCNVYRRFVPNFARIAGPLNALLKKGIMPFFVDDPRNGTKLRCMCEEPREASQTDEPVTFISGYGAAARPMYRHTRSAYEDHAWQPIYSRDNGPLHEAD